MVVVFFASTLKTGYSSQYPTQISEELILQLKAELKDEVYQEVKKELPGLIAQEVKKEFERQLASNAAAGTPQTDGFDLSAANHKDAIIREQVRQVVAEILAQNRQLQKVSDPALDEYTAGSGIPAQLTIAGGLSKVPAQSEFELAAAGEAASKPKLSSSQASADSDVTSIKKTESIERTLQQKGSILLPKGTLTAEPSFTYAHFSSNRITVNGILLLDAFAIGDIATERIRRDIFVETFAFKYGLLNNLQTELKIPFREEHDDFTRTSSTGETTQTAGGLGDIEFGASRQIAWENGIVPDLIAALNVKTNSGEEPYNNDIGLGTGHWAIRSSLIAAKSSDPVVIFSSLNYTHSFGRTIDNIGEIEPGDTLGYSLGTAIALSYQTAINFSFDHSITFKTQRNNEAVSGSFLNVANFKAGLNWAISERSSVDFAVGVGLTADSPDFTVELRFPYTF